LSGRPNSMAGWLHFESVQAETWRLHSHIGLQECPMPESLWNLGGEAGRPSEWSPGSPSPPNRLN
jgi:hypothetical protein